MNIYLGRIVRLEMPLSDRRVLVESMQGQGVFLAELGFSHKRPQVGDYVLIVNTTADGAFSYAIPLDTPQRGADTGNQGQGLDTVRIWWGMPKPDASTPETPIYEIELSDNGIDIRGVSGASPVSRVQIATTGVKVQASSIELSSTQGATTSVTIKGNPQPSQQSVGGFSQILYCPFTGAPHNTDSLMP